MRTQAVEVTTPAPRQVWEALLASDAGALVSQTPAWLDCICAMGGYEDASRLYHTREGRQCVLPMVRRKGLPTVLTTQAALPHGWGVGGLVGPDAGRPETIAAVLADLASQAALRTSVRPRPLNAEMWAVAAPRGIMRESRLTHVLDLTGGFDEVWTKRFNTHTRNKIHKAEHSGLVVECGSLPAHVSAFYELYMRWIERRARERHVPLSLARRLGRQREPLRKFQLVVQRLGDACRIWIARLDGQLAAASITLVWGANAIYWRSASDKELAGPTRANDLLQKLMIEHACQAGCRFYHMGESGGVASLMQFKRRFGAQECFYAEYSFERLPIGRVHNWLHSLGLLIDRQLSRSQAAANA